MTLVASTPNNDLTPQAVRRRSDVANYNEPFDDDETLSPMDILVQSLGHPGGNSLPAQFGQVSIEHSSDVHFGDKNIYHGPVTIKQVVYANGTPLVSIGDAKDNLVGSENGGFEEKDGDECRRDCADSDGANVKQLEVANNPGGGRTKGYIWLHNVSKHRSMEIGIFLSVLVLFLVVLVLVIILKGPQSKKRPLFDTDEQDAVKQFKYNSDVSVVSQVKNKLRVISRIDWVAQPPSNTTTPLVTPVPYVIIHHTATDNCTSIGRCVLHVRVIQNFHIESRQFYDIGYNFLVGGDGSAYEGRGWTVEGAHLLGYNARSIGIAFIGTFTKIKPPEIQLLACKRLIEKGVELGYIREDYKLFGARQLMATESPGETLYGIMKTWPHWAPEP